MINRFLFTKIDNSPLIIFRVFFGILVALECYGAIVTGWVKRTLIEPQFTFNFIGLEWLQPLPGSGMYLYFLVMGTLGVLIAIGYKYRFAIISFTLLWAAVYFMQKTSYNNHYYLLVLISGLIVFFPANRYFSVDVKQNPSLERQYMPSWVKWVIILQLFIVYTYASIAKMYGDWLDFSMIKLLMSGKADYYVIGNLLQEPWLHKILGVCGILFDLLIVPALLWKPTRKWAFFASLFFHLFNAIVFQIGIFPFLSLAFTVFFFEARTIKNIFLKKKVFYSDNGFETPSYKPVLLLGFGIYFLFQLLLPIRHYFIKDKVLWTEEGHRLSWRMMLRSRVGKAQFKVVNNKSGKVLFINPKEYLTGKQRARVTAYPDFAWQFAQHLKKEYAKKGEAVSVYMVNSKISINGRSYAPFIDPKVDLGKEEWNHFGHHEWILPSQLD